MSNGMQDTPPPPGGTGSGDRADSGQDDHSGGGNDAGLYDGMTR
jgi:hypothetical protein